MVVSWLRSGCVAPRGDKIHCHTLHCGAPWSIGEKARDNITPILGPDALKMAKKFMNEATKLQPCLETEKNPCNIPSSHSVDWFKFGWNTERQLSNNLQTPKLDIDFTSTIVFQCSKNLWGNYSKWTYICWPRTLSCMPLKLFDVSISSLGFMMPTKHFHCSLDLIHITGWRKW